MREADWYWQEFNLDHKGLEWTAANWSRGETPEYVKEMLAYIEGHAEQFCVQRGALTDERAQKRQEKEYLAIGQLSGKDGICALVDEFHLHWQLRDHLGDAKQRDMNNPQPDCLYINEDFQEFERTPLEEPPKYGRYQKSL